MSATVQWQPCRRWRSVAGQSRTARALEHGFGCLPLILDEDSDADRLEGMIAGAVCDKDLQEALQELYDALLKNQSIHVRVCY